MDDGTILSIAAAISTRLNGLLADRDAQLISLTRDEALLTLGLVDGVSQLMEREQQRLPPFDEMQH